MAYIGQEPGQGQAERFLYTTTGTGTAVTADDDGLPIRYTVNQVSVYLNGVKQVIGSGKDVTATDGSTITFLSAYASGDVIEVIALSSFSAADSVPATGGTYTGQVTLPSPVINTAVSGSAVLDEDAMGSNSATKLATQQSIKAYVDAQTHDSALTTEQVQDIAGGMFSSNTETGITATYQDGDGTVDLVVGTLNQDTTGTAATVTTAAQPAITSVGTLNALKTAQNYGTLIRDESAFYSGFRYDTVSTETFVIAAKSATTKIMIATGHDINVGQGTNSTGSYALPTSPELTITNGSVETSTTGKIIQRGEAFMKTLHNSWVMGG